MEAERFVLGSEGTNSRQQKGADFGHFQFGLIVLLKLTFLWVLLLRPEQFQCSEPKVSGSNNIVSTAGHDMSSWTQSFSVWSHCFVVYKQTISGAAGIADLWFMVQNYYKQPSEYVSEITSVVIKLKEGSTFISRQCLCPELIPSGRIPPGHAVPPLKVQLIKFHLIWV